MKKRYLTKNNRFGLFVTRQIVYFKQSKPVLVILLLGDYHEVVHPLRCSFFSNNSCHFPGRMLGRFHIQFF